MKAPNHVTVHRGRDFAPPGLGSWELDLPHFSRAASPIVAQNFIDHFSPGFAEGTRLYGVLLDRIEYQKVNGFLYLALRGVGAPKGATAPPPRLVFKLLTLIHPELRRRIRTASRVLEGRFWLQDMEHWDRETKPAATRKHLALQQVNLASLSVPDLIAHLQAAHLNSQEALYRHGRFTLTSAVPVGLYLDKACDWTGLHVHALLPAVTGYNDIAVGLAEKELDEVGRAYQDTPGAPSLDDDPASVLAALQRDEGRLGRAVRAWVEWVGYRLVTGYDLTELTALEMPDTLVGALKSRLTEKRRTHTQEKLANDIAKVRDQVPSPNRDEFDRLLHDAQLTSRIREERAHFNDGWANGVLRHGLLEAGRRLAADGVIHRADLVLDASMEEICQLLAGRPAATSDQLQDRRDWRLTVKAEDVPALLGPPPSPPPPSEWLPQDAARLARAMDFFLDAVFTATKEESSASVVRGLPVSRGVYEGTARIVLGPQDFSKLKQGDVLVTRSTSPYFNLALPLLGAIVTDRGGALSHAAIVAREYGIPAVVGTKVATTQIRDGQQVRVDGDAGTVEVLKA